MLDDLQHDLGKHLLLPLLLLGAEASRDDWEHAGARARERLQVFEHFLAQCRFEEAPLAQLAPLQAAVERARRAADAGAVDGRTLVAAAHEVSAAIRAWRAEVADG